MKSVISNRENKIKDIINSKKELNIVFMHGSYFPPHFGHLQAFGLAIEKLREHGITLDLCFAIPTYNSKHVEKKEYQTLPTDFESRQKSCETLFSNSFPEVFTIDVRTGGSGGARTELEKIFTSMYPEKTFNVYEIFGSDTALKYKMIGKRPGIIVVPRPEEGKDSDEIICELDKINKETKEELRAFITGTSFRYSSTDLRKDSSSLSLYK